MSSSSSLSSNNVSLDDSIKPSHNTHSSERQDSSKSNIATPKPKQSRLTASKHNRRQTTNNPEPEIDTTVENPFLAAKNSSTDKQQNVTSKPFGGFPRHGSDNPQPTQIRQASQIQEHKNSVGEASDNKTDSNRGHTRYQPQTTDFNNKTNIASSDHQPYNNNATTGDAFPYPPPNANKVHAATSIAPDSRYPVVSSSDNNLSENGYKLGNQNTFRVGSPGPVTKTNSSNSPASQVANVTNRPTTPSVITSPTSLSASSASSTSSLTSYIPYPDNQHILNSQQYYPVQNFASGPVNIDPSFLLNFNSLELRDGYNNRGGYRHYNKHHYNHYNNTKYYNYNGNYNNFNYNRYTNNNTNHYANKQMSSMYHVYVGNIPFSTQWQELKDHLRSAGDIYRVEIPESYDGKPKGFAIAIYVTKEGAQNAIDTFNNTYFQGRELTVRFDKYGNNHDLNPSDTEDPEATTEATDNEINEHNELDQSASQQEDKPAENQDLEKDSGPNVSKKDANTFNNNGYYLGSKSSKQNYRNNPNSNRYYRNNYYQNNSRYTDRNIGTRAGPDRPLNNNGLYISTKRLSSPNNMVPYMYFPATHMVPPANGFTPNGLNRLGAGSPPGPDYLPNFQLYSGLDSPAGLAPMLSRGPEIGSPNMPPVSGFVPNASKPLPPPFSPKDGFAQFSSIYPNPGAGMPYPMPYGSPGGASVVGSPGGYSDPHLVHPNMMMPPYGFSPGSGNIMSPGTPLVMSPISPMAMMNSPSPMNMNGLMMGPNPAMDPRNVQNLDSVMGSGEDYSQGDGEQEQSEQGKQNDEETKGDADNKHTE